MAGTCTGTTRAGAPCAAQAWRDGLCRWHHPDLEAERADWRRRGGEGRANLRRAAKRLPKDLLDVRDGLLRALAAVEAGDLEPGRANAIAGLSRAVVAVHQAADLEARIAALEALADPAGKSA